DLRSEVAVFRCGELEPVQVRPPDEPTDVDTTPRRCTENLADFTPCFVSQSLVGVPAPVGEHEQVAFAHAVDAGLQLAKVRSAVDERLYGVVFTPRLLAGVRAVDVGCRIAALVGCEKPIFGIHLPYLPGLQDVITVTGLYGLTWQRPRPDGSGPLPGDAGLAGHVR